MAGELVAEGAVLGSQAGVLCAGGVEPLAERVGGCAVRGGPAVLECFQGGDDLVQAGLDAAQVLGQALLLVIGKGLTGAVASFACMYTPWADQLGGVG